MEHTFKLRWLNGLLAGRELALPEGEIRLGGDDPDIALPLEQGAATVLVVTAEGISLNPPVPIWVEGLPWDATQPLPLQRVIDLAGQALVVGRAKERLPSLEVPPRRQTESARVTTGRWGQGKGLSLLLVMLLMMGIPAFFFLSSQSLSAPSFQPDIWLAEQMKQPIYHGLQARLDENGAVHLSGLVADEQSIRQLQQQIREYGLNIYDRSISAEKLRHRVREVLRMQGYHHVEVTQAETLDSVNIYGDIQSDKNWLATRDKLGEIEMLKHWRVINDYAELFNRLLEVLKADVLLEGLSIITTHQELLVSGQLSPQSAAKVHAAIDAFNHADKPRLRARYQNIPPPTLSEGVLPSAIVSVGGNADSVYLQLANNMRIRQGAMLPSGYKVYALTPHHLMLIRQQQLISIPLNL
jgi:type III secretion protein D